MLQTTVLVLFPTCVFELPKITTTSQEQGISLTPRVTTEADVGSWEVGWALAATLPADLLTLCYSFPLTTDND